MTTKKPNCAVSEADLARYTHGKLDALDIFGWRVPLGPVLKSRGGKVFHTPNGLAGFPDFAGVTKSGRFWVLELKAPKGRMSVLQLDWGDAFKAHNCLYAVAKSVEEINAFFEMVLTHN